MKKNPAMHLRYIDRNRITTVRALELQFHYHSNGDRQNLAKIYFKHVIKNGSG